MIDVSLVKKEVELVREKVESATTDVDRISLAYDSFDIESLLMVLENKPIEMTPSLDKYFDFVIEHDDVITKIFLAELYGNREFYEAQAHNVLTRFSLEEFDVLGQTKFDSQKFSKKESLEIIRTFLNSYDEKLDRLFMVMIDSGCIGTIDDFNLSDGIDGKCFWINSLGKTYILSGEKYNTLNNMSLLMHELGHAYEFYLLTGKSLDARQGIYATLHTEVTSNFMENAFNEFLRENNINLKEVYRIKQRYLKLLFEQFYQMYIAFCSRTFNNGTYFVKTKSATYRRCLKNIRKEFGYSIDLINREFNVNSLLAYGNSMITAVGLYDVFKNDKEFFKKHFEEIIMTYGMEKNPGIYECLGIKDEDLCEATMLVPEFEKQKELRLSLGIKK